MSADEIALARISEAFLTRAFARCQADDRLAKTVQDAIDADRAAKAVARREGPKIEAVADRFGLGPNVPVLPHVDEETQAAIAPSIIKLADAFAGALIAGRVTPNNLAKIVPQKERTVPTSDSFAAHGNAHLASLFRPE